MKTIIVDKSNLFKAVKANRGLHQKMAQEAEAGYRENAISWFKETLEKICNKGPIPTVVPLQPPEDHIEKYDRILGMLEMSIEDQIELTEGEFARYVLDDWAWKDSFVNVSATYGYTGPTGPSGSPSWDSSEEGE